MRFQQSTLIRFSGIIWLVMGFFLLRKGILFLMSTLEAPNDAVITFLKDWLGSAENGVALLVVIALTLGWIKGKTALKRSAQRVIARIRTQPNPMPIYQIYHWSFYLLVALMIGLSVSMTMFGVPPDIRGTILTTVGAALIHGSISYLRYPC